MAFAALAPFALSAAQHIGTAAASYAASQGIEYGVREGIPKALQKGREYTRRKGHKRAYKALTGIQKKYHSIGGQHVRAIASQLAHEQIGGKRQRYLKGLKPKKK